MTGQTRWLTMKSLEINFRFEMPYCSHHPTFIFHQRLEPLFTKTRATLQLSWRRDYITSAKRKKKSLLKTLNNFLQMCLESEVKPIFLVTGRKHEIHRIGQRHRPAGCVIFLSRAHSQLLVRLCTSVYPANTHQLFCLHVDHCQ